jgi:hypothetical protein
MDLITAEEEDLEATRKKEVAVNINIKVMLLQRPSNIVNIVAAVDQKVEGHHHLINLMLDIMIDKDQIIITDAQVEIDKIVISLTIVQKNLLNTMTIKIIEGNQVILHNQTTDQRNLVLKFHYFQIHTIMLQLSTLNQSLLAYQILRMKATNMRKEKRMYGLKLNLN